MKTIAYKTLIRTKLTRLSHLKESKADINDLKTLELIDNSLADLLKKLEAK